jgi:hypothetical protein
MRGARVRYGTPMVAKDHLLEKFDDIGRHAFERKSDAINGACLLAGNDASHQLEWVWQ